VGILDDRKRGLEEEYFHRKNKEAIEKLRQKMAVAEQAKAAGASSMQCPRCDGVLKESSFEGVLLDTCDKCAGVWLDASELEQVVKGNSSDSWLGELWDRLNGE
jgi:Zn-finger nucleic acid-binding protein